MPFYLTYLTRLNNYIEKYDKNADLEEIKNRLLYTLDMPERCLFRKERLNQEIQTIDFEDLDFEDSHFERRMTYVQ